MSLQTPHAFTPLHRLSELGPVNTAGRLVKGRNGVSVEPDTSWRLSNAFAEICLYDLSTSQKAEFNPGDLVRIGGIWTGHGLRVELVERVGSIDSNLDLPRWTPERRGPVFRWGGVLTARHHMHRAIRRFFDARGFIEVETPNWVPSPGTDPHLDPVPALFRPFPRSSRDQESADRDASGLFSAAELIEPRRETFATEQQTAWPKTKDANSEFYCGYLHTSPEFAMKELLAAGCERIFQLTKVWRNGEVTPWHNPEFTMLEWYRAWETVDDIMDDVEALTRQLLSGGVRVLSNQPFQRMSMQELVQCACGFDILQALEPDTLLDAMKRHDLLPRRLKRLLSSNTSNPLKWNWDELFFELQLEHLEPYLSQLGVVFVTDWPSPLAVLARRKPSDARVSERFELYIDGVELANGFGELTDPAEQRARMESELRQRQRLGLSTLPMPDHFLAALAYGLPPSAGVALGVERMLMLRLGLEEFEDVAPFVFRRDPDSGTIYWR